MTSEFQTVSKSVIVDLCAMFYTKCRYVYDLCPYALHAPITSSS